MIRLGLRLTLTGGREAAVRLAVIAAAVALGVGLLLVTPRRHQRGQRPERPLRLARTPASPAGSAERVRDADASRRPAVVAAARPTTSTARPSTGSTSPPPGPDSPVPPGIPRLPGPGRVLRLARAQRAAALHTRPPSSATASPGTRSARSAPSALPAPELADHRRRPHRRPSSRTSRAPRQVTQHPDHVAQQLQRRRLRRRRHQRRRHRPHPVGGGAGAAVPGADLHRHRDPAVGRPPGAAVRRDAPGRRDAAAGLGDLRGRGDRRRRRRAWRLASACSSLLRTPLAAVPFTGAPFFPGDLSLSADRRPGSSRSASRSPRPPAARLALRRVQISPLGVTRRVTPRPPRAYRLIPLRRRPRRARLLRRRRASRDHRRPDRGVSARLPADHGRAGHRRAVADHGRRPAHGPARPPARRAHRRRGGSPTTRGPASAPSAAWSSPCSSPAWPSG